MKVHRVALSEATRSRRRVPDRPTHHRAALGAHALGERARRQPPPLRHDDPCAASWSRRNCGTCVDLPQPVSPEMTSTPCSSSASSTACRCAPPAARPCRRPSAASRHRALLRRRRATAAAPPPPRHRHRRASHRRQRQPLPPPRQDIVARRGARRARRRVARDLDDLLAHDGSATLPARARAGVFDALPADLIIKILAQLVTETSVALGARAASSRTR